MLYSKTKYEEIDFHFVRKKVQTDDLIVEFIPSEKQDVLEKSFLALSLKE